MKVSKKCPTIAYTVLCIVLLLGLLAGIKYIVDLGNRLDNTSVSNDKIEWNDENSNDYESDEFIDGENLITQKLFKETTSYDIDVPYGEVMITSTDKTPYITYNQKRQIEVSTTNENKECKIRISGKYNIFDSFDIKDFRVNIYLPSDMIEKIDIDFLAGMLKMHDVKAKEFNLDMSAGESIIRDCDFLNINTELNAGNLDLYLLSNVKNVNCDVSAGNMNLFIPEDISGFESQYEVNLGNLENNLSFNIGAFNSIFNLNKKGNFSYGDKSCQINLEVSIGNISLNQYKLK